MAMRLFHAETRETAKGMEYGGESGMGWQKICFNYPGSFPY